MAYTTDMYAGIQQSHQEPRGSFKLRNILLLGPQFNTMPENLQANVTTAYPERITGDKVQICIPNPANF